jgi:outer membrane protein OmpA-like peptidoglycan-associated protein
MKKVLALVLTALVVLPGCGGRKKNKATTSKDSKKKTEVVAEVNMPLNSDDEMKSYFDADASELTLVDDKQATPDVVKAEAPKVEETKVAENDFTWTKEEASKDFANVYFDFDKEGVRQDQEVAVTKDIEHAKSVIARGETPVITVEGNACSSAGSRSYNLALSTNRAAVVADRFVAAGVDRENIKIVGRGQDNPALDAQGNPVSGSREQQWPNRRVEVKLYN